MTIDVVGFIAGLVTFLGQVGNTIIGALMSWLGTVVNALAALVAAALALLPPAENLGISIPHGWLQGYALFDRFLPLHEAIAYILILVAASILPIAWHLAIALYHLIPKPAIGT